MPQKTVSSGPSAPMPSYLPRTIEPVIREVSGFFKVVLLTGVRQCGKSTCLRQLVETDGSQRRFLTLDDIGTLTEAREAAGSFFRLHPTPLLLDEIQRSPDLMLQMKAEVDASDASGQIWATGSHKFSLMRGISESLAGRLIPLELLPLSIYERVGHGLRQKPYLPSEVPVAALPAPSPDEIWKTVWQGAWPKVVNATPRQRHFFFNALEETLLTKDVQAASGVRKLEVFRRFLRLLASRTGQELRLNTLSSELDVSVPTVREWLSVAEAAGLIFLLRPYSASIGKQLVKSPKIYFTDTGLAAHLCGIGSPEALRTHKDAGAFFETFAVTELLKSWIHNGERADFFFYRDSKKMEEIDLLIRHENTLYPVEIKSGTHPNASAVKHFRVLKDLPEAVGRGAVICMTTEPYALSDTVTAHSLWAI